MGGGIDHHRTLHALPYRGIPFLFTPTPMGAESLHHPSKPPGANSNYSSLSSSSFPSTTAVWITCNPHTPALNLYEFPSQFQLSCLKSIIIIMAEDVLANSS